MVAAVLDHQGVPVAHDGPTGDDSERERMLRDQESRVEYWKAEAERLQTELQRLAPSNANGSTGVNMRSFSDDSQGKAVSTRKAKGEHKQTDTERKLRQHLLATEHIRMEKQSLEHELELTRKRCADPRTYERLSEEMHDAAERLSKREHEVGLLRHELQRQSEEKRAMQAENHGLQRELASLRQQLDYVSNSSTALQSSSLNSSRSNSRPSSARTQSSTCASAGDNPQDNVVKPRYFEHEPSSIGKTHKKPMNAQIADVDDAKLRSLLTTVHSHHQSAVNKVTPRRCRVQPVRLAHQFSARTNTDEQDIAGLEVRSTLSLGSAPTVRPTRYLWSDRPQKQRERRQSHATSMCGENSARSNAPVEIKGARSGVD